MESASTTNDKRVIHFIDETVQKIEHQLRIRPHGKPSITLSRITGVKATHGSGLGEVRWVADDHQVTYSFPGKTKEEAWRFACVLRILCEIQFAISENVVVTKRDIFYHDPVLFLKQEVVDRYIDDIAHTCKVKRSDLNVIASPKGLVAGLDPSGDRNEAETIPSTKVAISVAHIRWVLVVEKEATFNTLLGQKFHMLQALGGGLMITAKGYPDLATRQFLRGLIDSHGFKGPIIGLFDYDAYGIDILKCYRLGSKASIGENLAFPEMKWIGVRWEDILILEGTMTLSQIDRTKARNLLDGMMQQDEAVPAFADCRIELQRMLMLNKKAEIQALDDDTGRLSRWLESKVLTEFRSHPMDS